MANVSSVGIGSGVLTSDLIDQLVAAERDPIEKRLDFKEEEVSAELSIFGQIQSAVTDFRLPSRALSDPNLFNSLNVNSSSSAFSASADSTAAPGTYTLEVTTLATSHSLSTDEYSDPDAVQIGEGTLDITVNGQTTSITVDGTNNTLNGIASAINDEDDLAVTASVINTGTGYKLVFSSDETGVENSIEIAVTDSDGSLVDGTGLSELNYSGANLNLNQNQQALDADFTFNGIAVSRSSNTVDDLIQGVTLTLSGENNSAEVFTISRDEDEIVEKVQEFIDKFNALQALISENTKFNPDNPAASGLLLGDSSTRTIMNQVQNTLGQTIQGLGSASVRSASELGITTNKDTGQLQFDSAMFKKKLSANPEDVAAVFADQGRTTDGQIEFVRAGTATKVGTYDIDVTQIATRGAFTGSVALSGATTIDASNDELTLTVDGVTSGAINLTAGAYTDAELVAEIQAQINADSALSAAGKRVTVSLDGSNQLVITSNEYGSSSKVEINSVDTNSAAQLGLSVAAGVDGLDVAGTINGVAATGSGQFLTAADGDDSESISLKVTGGATGSRGTVSYIEGIGEQMVDLINNFLSADGVITIKNEALNTQLNEIAQDRVDLNERLETLNERLVRQFTSADIAISRLNSTLDFVKQQLDALSGNNKDD